MLEAERAKDEVRDILTRMIGSEIRYTQLGYWSRSAPYGYKTDKIETNNGKRTILAELPSEGQIIKRMYELRSQGTLSDEQIAQEMNRLGFKTPVKIVRDKHDRTRVARQTGGKPMTSKLLRAYIKKTIYAGVNTEKWTGEKPVKCKFAGLVSIELFNAANRGKIQITIDPSDPDHPVVGEAPKNPKFVKKNVFNNEFPYRKVICCPECNHLLLGSASRGRLGKYYPAYHCSHHGHYFRVPRKDFDAAVSEFIERVTVKPERFNEVMEAVIAVWKKRQAQVDTDKENYAKRREELESEIKVIVNKMKIVNSQTAIKYMEEDVVKLEQEITNLETKNEETATKKNRRHTDHLEIYQILCGTHERVAC